MYVKCKATMTICQEHDMNDRERELWVMNDEGLYRWWKSTRKTLRSFIRENRQVITDSINRAMGR